MQIIKPASTPVIKWVGGKTQLLPELLARVPGTFDTYHEPFLGGGALFLAISPAKASLSDTNRSLVNLYVQMQNQHQELLTAVRLHETVFNELPINERAQWFYEVRSAFNSGTLGNLQWAAHFLALNKTCFNGLYRENAKGEFNVPFGHSKSKVSFANSDTFSSASRALQGATLQTKGFEAVLEAAKAGDFVYFDPPYVPLNTTSAFTNYQAAGFDLLMQQRLISVARELREKGVYVMLSNSLTPWVLENYSQAGFRVEEVDAKRMVAARVSSRSTVKEALILGY